MSGFWTEDRIARAAKIWNDGGSGGEVARQLGCSRNAAIGIAYRNPDLFNTKPKRIKLARLPRQEPKFRPKSVKPIAPPRVAALRTVATVTSELQELFETAEPTIEKVDPSFAPIRPIPFLLVTDMTCRWPLWQMPENPGGQGLCCGDPADAGSSWCTYHRGKARQAA
jgi:GcrA cell cycle regulator